MTKLCAYYVTQVQSADVGLKGAPKWKSCWASLADSYTESGPSSGIFDIPSQMEVPRGGKPPDEMRENLK